MLKFRKRIKGITLKDVKQIVFDVFEFLGMAWLLISFFTIVAVGPIAVLVIAIYCLKNLLAGAW